MAETRLLIHICACVALGLIGVALLGWAAWNLQRDRRESIADPDVWRRSRARRRPMHDRPAGGYRQGGEYLYTQQRETY